MDSFLEKTPTWWGAAWGYHAGGYDNADSPVRNSTDGTLWCDNSNFSVKTLLNKIEAVADQGVSIDKLVCSVWVNIAPPKVELMMWLALLGRLNTKAMLCRKGIISPQAVHCTFCHTKEEGIDHLLVNCSVSWGIWEKLAVELGYNITRHDTLWQHHES